MHLVGNVQLVRGDASTVESLVGELEKDGYSIRGNPDAYVRVYTHFGIDESRELRERAQTRALGDRKVFIIAASQPTQEAQNALLKTLEEPAGESLFFFIVPSPHALLPTLRSRTQTFVLAQDGKDRNIEYAVDAEKFLRSSPRERVEMIKPLLEKDEDDRRDLASVITFLSSLERMLSKRPGGPAVHKEGLDAIYRARKYVTDKGSLMKALLEQVALLVPIMK